MNVGEKLNAGGFTSFAAYIRALAIEAMEHPQEPCDDYDHEVDGVFFESLNRYLKEEKQEPIPVEEIDSLPRNFAHSMAQAVDFDTLSNSENVHNTGADMQDRVLSRKRNAILADYYGAICDYLGAKREPILVKTSAKNFKSYSYDELTEEDSRPCLYKQKITFNEDGTSRRAIEQVEHIDFSKKVVICAGGANASRVNTGELLGTLKQVETLLGGKEIYHHADETGDIELYCFGYPIEHRMNHYHQTKRYNADPESYVIPCAQQIFDAYFKPVLDEAVRVDKESDGIASSKAALRKLNFFCSSYGGTIVKTLCNVTTRYYESHGYSNAQIKALLPEVFSMHINPTSRLDDEKPCGNFSAIYAVNDTDLFVRSRSDNARLLDEPDKVPQTIPISDNELMIWTHRPNYGVVSDMINQALDYHDGGMQKSAEKTVMGSNSGHTLKLMVSDVYEKEAEQPTATMHKRPKEIVNALRNAMANKTDGWNIRDFMNKSVELFKTRHPEGIRFRVRPTHVEIEELKRNSANDVPER